mmetsp:Transcript_44454/g.122996  ORF Transcript_44454/g.122996 Transcript_44454/m.122996 type:complete len:248 (-) Transcript_44454:1742-2485(-)
MRLRGLSRFKRSLRLLVGLVELFFCLQDLRAARGAMFFLFGITPQSIQSAEIAHAHCEFLMKPCVHRDTISLRPFLRDRVLLFAVLVNDQLASLSLRRVGPLKEGPNLAGVEIVLLVIRLEGRLSETHLEDLESEHFVLDQPTQDEAIYAHLPFLADSEGAVHRLRIRSGIPRRVNENHTVGARQIEADAAYSCREQHTLETFQLLVEFGDLFGAVDSIGLAVYAQAPQATRPEHANLDQVQHLDAL